MKPSRFIPLRDDGSLATCEHRESMLLRPGFMAPCGMTLRLRLQYGSCVFCCPLHGVQELYPMDETAPELEDGSTGDEGDPDLEQWGLG